MSSDCFDDFELSEPLLRGVAKAGFETPTPVQAAVIPVLLDGTDVMVAAATGSGKTAAFLLPIMQRLLDAPAPRAGARVLVLVPTRELAQQIRDHFLALASFTRLEAGVIIGGEPRNRQIALLRRNPDILIATPGRLRDHLETGAAELDDLGFLVLDEADRMLDMGFAEDVISIIGHAATDRQSMLFSATLQQRGLDAIAELLLREPETIFVDDARDPHPDIEHQYLLSDEVAHKQRQLDWLLRNEPFNKALIFTNTRDRAEQLGGYLIGQGNVRCAVLHGELDQRERKRVMGLFQRGEISALIATDVAARGLDIAGVELVINFDVPRSGEGYLHRTGRTGRAGRAGVAISLVAASDWNTSESIQRYLKLNWKKRSIEGLAASFQGSPKRPKAAKGKKPNAKPQPKVKQRLRDRKNVGKRRLPSKASEQAQEAGSAPPPRRRSRKSPEKDDPT